MRSMAAYGVWRSAGICCVEWACKKRCLNAGRFRGILGRNGYAMFFHGDTRISAYSQIGKKNLLQEAVGVSLGSVAASGYHAVRRFALCSVLLPVRYTALAHAKIDGNATSGTAVYSNTPVAACALHAKR